MAERPAVNRMVAGSSPAVPAILKAWLYSSVGQSNRLITGRSLVQVQVEPPKSFGRRTDCTAGAGAARLAETRASSSGVCVAAGKGPRVLPGKSFRALLTQSGQSACLTSRKSGVQISHGAPSTMCGVSSARSERLLDTQEAAGSNPARRTRVEAPRYDLAILVRSRDRLAAKGRRGTDLRQTVPLELGRGK